MQAVKPLRSTLLAVVLGTATLALTAPGVQAQNVNAQIQNALKRQSADALSAAQRDFAQFASAQQQLRGGGSLKQISHWRFPTCRI
ncbi:hypothetical protein LP419_22265 [Massilia sp. H-1]|nr:hypothetical protein LP419_22265 [Massilia sp. H-1]